MDRHGLLVVTRRLGESVKVGEDVEVFVLKSKEGRVRLGIRAPRSTSVSRARDERVVASVAAEGDV